MHRGLSGGGVAAMGGGACTHKHTHTHIHTHVHVYLLLFALLAQHSLFCHAERYTVYNNDVARYRGSLYFSDSYSFLLETMHFLTGLAPRQQDMVGAVVGIDAEPLVACVCVCVCVFVCVWGSVRPHKTSAQEQINTCGLSPG